MACTAYPAPRSQTHYGVDSEWSGERLDSGGARVHECLLGGLGAVDVLGHGRLGGHTGTAGLRERHDPVEAAGNSAELRLADGIKRWSSGAAAARPGRRCVRLLRLTRDQRRYRVDRGALPPG